MAHDYQARQDDGLWYWATMHKVTRFFDDVIITYTKTYKNHISLSKNFFPFMIFFPTPEL